PRLAHLFMICSNIKLTGPAESIGIDTPSIHERNQRDLGMDVQRKLEILADAAKYDASCASSGTEKRDSSDGKGLGSTARHGHLPFLRAGWTLHLAVEGAAHQRLQLRLLI